MFLRISFLESVDACFSFYLASLTIGVMADKEAPPHSVSKGKTCVQDRSRACSSVSLQAMTGAARRGDNGVRRMRMGNANANARSLARLLCLALRKFASPQDTEVMDSSRLRLHECSHLRQRDQPQPLSHFLFPYHQSLPRTNRSKSRTVDTSILN